MSTLFTFPTNHPRIVSVDCCATCKATERQISPLNLWIVNGFGQNVTLFTGHSMVEQLLGLIGLPSWPSTQNQLCGCLTTKNPDVPLSTELNWLGRCKPLLIRFKKSDTASAGSNHSRSSLYLSFVRQQIQCACVCMCLSVSEWMRVKGWHPLLTGAHRVPSTSQFRQCLTSVGIGHTRLNNNLPGSPSSYSPSCLFYSLLFSHCYIVSFSGSWLSHCSDGQWRKKKKEKIVMTLNTAMHILEENLKLKSDANHHRVVLPWLLVRQQRKHINM